MVASAAESVRGRAGRGAMKQISFLRRLQYTSVALSAFFLATLANASGGDFYQSYTQTKVIARLPLSGGGATRMFLRQDGKTRYLYVQRASQEGFTVIDVTKPGRPRLIHRVPLETLTVMGSGLMVTETPDRAAPTPSGVDKGNEAQQGNTLPETVHVLEVNDRTHSGTVRILNGVSSIVQDPARNLIYMVNGDGVWILSQRQGLRPHQCGSSDAISPIPNCN